MGAQAAGGVFFLDWSEHPRLRKKPLCVCFWGDTLFVRLPKTNRITNRLVDFWIGMSKRLGKYVFLVGGGGGDTLFIHQGDSQGTTSPSFQGLNLFWALPNKGSQLG